jgi:hypothetical protein
VLGRLGIYTPITHYDKETLWKDLSAHRYHQDGLAT